MGFYLMPRHKSHHRQPMTLLNHWSLMKAVHRWRPMAVLYLGVIDSTPTYGVKDPTTTIGVLRFRNSSTCKKQEIRIIGTLLGIRLSNGKSAGRSAFPVFECERSHTLACVGLDSN